jgi:hypothetical protein
MQKVIKILINSIPVLIMIGLIPLVKNDYWLMFLYIVIIIVSLKIKYHKKEIPVFIFGFIMMIIFEYIFISTGVETFIRNSLWGIMPLWLPFLWGYGFIAIKRAVHILEMC